jgi:exosortase A-associated hydrolase 1
MSAGQQALRFACRDRALIGVLHRPVQPATRAMLIVTGGPQYRAGSHRQFVLLGRHLAKQSIAVMRFDTRGMGDSEGDLHTFEHIDDDVRAALDALLAAMPTLREVVLWGLCDGATAAAFYAADDRRITGLVLLNPWVRTETGAAQATLRHYYLQRLVSAAFWRNLASGAVDAGAAITSFRQTAAAALTAKAKRQPDTDAGSNSAGDLPARLHRALTRFPGPILFILSGADLGAREFSALSDRHPHWRRLLDDSRVTRADIAHANHTFARKVWRDRVADLTTEWIKSW